MISEKTQKIIEEIKSKKSLSEIARDNGVSRQRVHEIKSKIGKYRTPKEKKTIRKNLTKKEIEDRLEAEIREKAILQAEIDALKQKEWKEHLSLAFDKLNDVLSKAFGGTVRLLRFEHVDGAGYWFSFELINDSTRQTYRVGHDEIGRENK